MNKLELNEIQIIPVKPQNGLVAFASCVINNQFYIGNIAIYTLPASSGNYRLVYPTKVLPNGKQINCFHPINRETGDAIKKEISDKYKLLIKE